LVGASFFDATLDGSNFEGADMTLANVEMAQFNRANLKVKIECVLADDVVRGDTYKQVICRFLDDSHVSECITPTSLSPFTRMQS